MSKELPVSDTLIYFFEDRIKELKAQRSRWEYGRMFEYDLEKVIEVNSVILGRLYALRDSEGVRSAGCGEGRLGYH